MRAGRNHVWGPSKGEWWQGLKSALILVEIKVFHGSSLVLYERHLRKLPLHPTTYGVSEGKYLPEPLLCDCACVWDSYLTQWKLQTPLCSFCFSSLVLAFGLLSLSKGTVKTLSPKSPVTEQIPPSKAFSFACLMTETYFKSREKGWKQNAAADPCSKYPECLNYPLLQEVRCYWLSAAFPLRKFCGHFSFCLDTAHNPSHAAFSPEKCCF